MTSDDLIPHFFDYLLVLLNKLSRFLINNSTEIARSYSSPQLQIGEHLGNMFENSQCLFDVSCAEKTQLTEGSALNHILE